MKYSTSNPPMACLQTNSTCYKNTQTMVVKGVLWHSTGANNPNLKRYVQPLESDKNYQELIAKIGKNQYNNDYNHADIDTGLNAFIGKMANGEVTTLQTMPWNYKPWGCGGGCNNGWIQFECCEDSLTDRNYFNTIYKEACELTAYLCKIYGLNPKGTVNYNGKQVPVILCHADAYKLGLGSNHGDVYEWFNKYGKTMDDVRNDVANLLNNTNSNPSQEKIIQQGDEGEEVKQLQSLLIKLGFSCGEDGADGIFGPNTKNAVVKFQNANKLIANGIVNESLMKMIIEKSSNIEELYRVRKEWTDAKSQKGAYKILENAKKQCDKLGSEYSVFNSKGEIVYTTAPKEKETEVEEKERSSTSITAQDVIKIAQNEIGYHEKNSSNNLDEKLGDMGSGNFTKYSRDLFAKGYYGGGNKQGLPWCDVFTDWCFLMACGGDAKRAQELQCQTGPNGAMCKYSAQYYKEKGQWSNTPMVGAQIFFYYDGDINHTGIVESINGTTITTIEGNSGDKVSRNSYNIKNEIIAGYGIPAYSDISQQKEEKISSYLVKVCANVLNVRSQPDMSAAVTALVKKDDVYTIVEEKGEWGKLKSGVGWINLSYVKKI